ncbi:hypothetical protein [Pseudolactococcus insecticola]|uniref:Uncharacterized protein n=1 Tax=Pseudolactococcus insecticola TaxID=2709158 RepID=A0A6A0B5S0_9LACT|nr:hypothetical protein [Lactococcus insecticola]GFH40033.1 hypothetical protein Hs20B_04310 [Lactococcus insecticola]
MVTDYRDALLDKAKHADAVDLDKLKSETLAAKQGLFATKTCTAVNTKELQSFALGLAASKIDEFADSRFVTADLNYLKKYDHLINLISAMDASDNDSIERVSSELKAMRLWVENHSVENATTLVQLKTIAADVLAGFEPARDDMTIQTAYNALKSAYNCPKTTVEDLNKLVHNFYAALPAFRTVSRGYMFDLMDGVQSAMASYGMDTNLDVQRFLSESKLMIHAAARPFDFILIVNKLDDLNDNTCKIIMKNSPIEEIQRLGNEMIYKIDDARQNGLQFAECDLETVEKYRNTLSTYQDRDELCKVVKSIKNIQIKTA